MDQAKWLYGEKFRLNGGRFPEEYARKRSLFYMEVLKWQLNNRGVKRFHYKSKNKNIAHIRVFCGPKKAAIVSEEALNVVWALELRDDESYFRD